RLERGRATQDYGVALEEKAAAPARRRTARRRKEGEQDRCEDRVTTHHPPLRPGRGRPPQSSPAPPTGAQYGGRGSDSPPAAWQRRSLGTTEEAMGRIMDVADRLWSGRLSTPEQHPWAAVQELEGLDPGGAFVSSFPHRTRLRTNP